LNRQIREKTVNVSSVQTRSADVLRTRQGYLFLKRILDFVVSLAALVLLLPLLLLIALLVRLDSPGQALFVQTRIGKDGDPFKIFKFRTLPQNIDDSGHREFMSAFVRGKIHRGETGRVIYKPFSPSQITPVGRVLRRTGLDELPQLINVLRGEMSLVGPRPNVPWEVEAYEDWHKMRLTVLPGITGLAQVNGRSGLDFDSIAGLDIEYIRRQSLSLDLRILLETVRSALGGRGAR
jgi:lipopolysaccharide/colanic/teichoic acid biosynthesis glycosyltransferase